MTASVQAAPTDEIKACRSNLEACEQSIHAAPTGKIQVLCGAALPFACSELIDRYAKEARNEGKEEPSSERPTVCREGEPTYDEEACKLEASKAMQAMMAATMSSKEPKPLPASRLNTLPAMCLGNDSAGLCQKVADQLWIAGRYAEAVPMLNRACKPLKDTAACDLAKQLVSIDEKALAAPAPDALPCGHYVSSKGLLSEPTFGDRGKVKTNFSTLRARLENGLVRIRHDRGDDFVLRRLADGRLLGIDTWNQYAVYVRDGGPSTCAAPVVYQEAELKADCRPGEDIAACCKRGGLQGCNGMGHKAALAGKWSDAVKFYEPICAANVRAGCENMVAIYGRGGDESAKPAVEAICAKNPEAVACDIADVTNWSAVGMGHAMEDAMRGLDMNE